MKFLKQSALLLILSLVFTSAALAQDHSEASLASDLPQKVMYITFDDGPKDDTPELLALLEELDVPATFFLVGARVRAFPDYARMIYEAGYPIGYHSMAHSYSYLKEDARNISADLERFTGVMREVVGEAFETDLFRFPGGSTSYSNYAHRYVAAQGYAWFDWNGMTGDTLPNMNAEKVEQYALKTSGSQDVIILLAHEGKRKTRDALVGIVEHYRALGYEFRTLSTNPQERLILERCPANMRLPAIVTSPQIAE
ncbi:MAG: polysaccharide deacetylase family protein [Candidatus Ventricola sp.]